MKPDGKKRKKPIAAVKKDDDRVDGKKKSKKKKKAKKQKSIENDVVDVGKEDNVMKKASSTSLMESIFGGSNGAAISNDGTKEGKIGTTASSSLITSIFDIGEKKSTTTKNSSATMSLFNNPSIPVATRRNHQQQQQVIQPRPATDTSHEETAESIRRTLRNRKQRSQNRPLLRRALDFPGVFQNEENEEGNFLLDDENERAKETADAIRDHGFCVLRNVMDLNDKKKNHKNEDCHPLRDVVLPKAKDLQRKLNEALKARGIHHSTETFRFRQAASRCRGRTDVVFDAFDRDSQMVEAKRKVLRNPKIFPVIRNLLGASSSGSDDDNDDRDVKLVYAGLIFSYPGSCDQPWHQDGEPLFPELPGDQSAVLQASLPPYALNVFLPLEDEDGSIEKGPTEFLPGSHKWTDPDERLKSIVETTQDEGKEEADESDASADSDDETVHDENAIIAPVLKQGDALIYDYRVCHRGTANLFGKLEKTEKDKKNKAIDDQNDVVGSRRILYLMYARPWFTDHVNFDYTKSAESLWDDQKSVNAKK